MLKLRYIVVLAFFSSSIFSQDISNAYFLMGVVDNYERDIYDPYYRKKYEKVLYRVNNDTLQVFDTLSTSGPTNLEYLIQLNDEKLFYFEEKDNMMEVSFPNIFSVLDYSNDTIQIRRYFSEEDKSYTGFSPYTRAFKINEKLYIQNEGGAKLYGVAIDRYFQKREVTYDDFNFIYDEGEASPYHFGLSFFYQYFNNDFSKLRITIGQKDVDTMVDAPFQIPKHLLDTTANKIYIILNNERWFLGLNDFYTGWLLDKSSGNWKKIQLPWSKVKIREPWLYGVNQKSISELKEMIGAEKLWQLNRELEWKNRERYDLDYGRVPRLIDKTGVLFFKHIPSGKMLRWDTKELDSEILGFREGWVYYRQYDEIRCLYLDADKVEITEDKLLLKNSKVIPFVHWMFFHDSKQKSLNERK